jgi:radical SAM protein with 4Fe4S-binding SPASM domain
MAKLNFSRIREQFNVLRAKFTSASVRLYHYERRSIGERSRIHLRIDPDGSGLLSVNANRIMHLNTTAAVMAYQALEGKSDDQAYKVLQRKFDGPLEQIKEDYAHFTKQLDELLRPDGACPIHDLGLEVSTPFSTRPTAPYRMDLALTYRCNNDCNHCYNARSRDYPELTTEKWKRILDNLWTLGIPHVVFTGGEPTLRNDLPELIAHAEGNGQITGINTNGRRLSDSKYVDRLVQAGLDHVQITLESHQSVVHDNMVNTRGAWKQTVTGIKNALDSPLFVMTNTTMLADNHQSMAETLDYLASLGVPTVGLNALIYAGHGSSVGTGLKESQLAPILNIARSKTDKNKQRLIWYTPTQYCHFDPVQLELGVKGCSAALYNMCIEPDGGVIPCQSYYQQLGNLLSNSWNSIWNHQLAISLRERANIPQKCHGCSLLPECGGGCPLFAQHQNEIRKEI